MDISKNYISGKFVSSNRKFEVTNPFDNSIIAQCFYADEKQIETAIAGAEKSKKALQYLPAYERYEILMQIALAIKEQNDALAKTLSRESGKPLKYAVGEVARAIQTFTVAAEESKRLPSEFMQIDWTAAAANKEAIVKYFPKGIVAGITPFNFPLNLVAHKIAPAIAAGCPIILKPDPRTPLSALALAKIIDNTKLPKGALSILNAEIEKAKPLIEDERIKVLSFTGSAKAGWQLKKQAGKKTVLLELGGNAGLIIAKSADIENAITQSLVGGFAYSGQVCIHTQRIFVHKDHCDYFTKSFVKKVNQLKQGNPIDKNTDLAVMIDEQNAKRIAQWVDEAKNSGATILCGGKRSGAFYPPTVMINTKPEMKVSCEEVFGPVVTIEKYVDFEHTVNKLNESRYGLQAGLFSDSQKEIDYAFNEIEVGGLIINDVPTFRADHMPYGGVKDSGLGREGLKYAILDYMEPRILVKPIN